MGHTLTMCFVWEIFNQGRMKIKKGYSRCVIRVKRKITGAASKTHVCMGVHLRPSRFASQVDSDVNQQLNPGNLVTHCQIFAHTIC